MRFYAFARAAAIGSLTVGAACGRSTARRDASVRGPGLYAERLALDPERFRRHVEELSSDRYEGRGPGTRGEDLTISYLVRHLQEAGLEPGAPGGSYVQDVPLRVLRYNAAASFRGSSRTVTLAAPRDFSPFSQDASTVALDSAPVIFAGYGIAAPEYGWDDYAGADVRGAVVLVLEGDPPAADPREPSKLDERRFDGARPSPYASRTSKFRTARARGAAAAFVVHETGVSPAPFEALANAWSQGRMTLATSAPTSPDTTRPPVFGYISQAGAAALFDAAGQQLDSARAAAGKDGFRAVRLTGTAALRVAATARPLLTRNVVAKRTGSDSLGRDEYVLFTAHWDHLGRDSTRAGDQIFNGAMDNAGGVAQLLEIARAFARFPRAPRRTVVFVATAAEEFGLLGARHYVRNPLYPLANTVAVLNLDWFTAWGRTRDVVNISAGHTTLDQVLADAAAAQGRVVVPDPAPDQLYFERSDHFPFAESGVPSLFAGAGLTYVGRPADYGPKRDSIYMDRDYHRVSDEVRPDWDYTGAVEDAALWIAVGRSLADSRDWPEWTAATRYPEFRARRDSTRAQSRR